MHGFSYILHFHYHKHYTCMTELYTKCIPNTGSADGGSGGTLAIVGAVIGVILILIIVTVIGILVLFVR